MKNSDKKLLAELLTKWFKEANFESKNIWNKNEVAKIIASNIRRLGNWKKNMDPSTANRLKKFRFVSVKG